MSQENVELVRAGFAAHNRGDLDALVEFYDPDVVFETLLLGTHRGNEAIRLIYEENQKTLSGYDVVPVELIDAGDQVVAVAQVTGTGSTSQIVMEDRDQFAFLDAPDGKGPVQSTGRLRSRLSSGRRLARIAYRDPEHVAERLTLFGSERLSESALEWAKGAREERPDVPRGVIAEEVRIQTAQVARIDGAVSGTPFLIALIPGYLAYLWQEGVMERRIAALYGREPHSLQTSAQVLVLRGVHPTVDAAREALVKVRETHRPPRNPPHGGRFASGSEASTSC